MAFKEPFDTLPTTESTPRLSNASDDGDYEKREVSNAQRILRHLRSDINVAYADIPVISTCIVSGLCDSGAYNAWNCFVSMQTGNTVFLALGASNQPATSPYGWLRSLTSIVFFLAGCVCFSLSRHFRPKSRGTLCLSFLLQALCIVIAASLVQAHVIPSPVGTTVRSRQHMNFKELIPLAFLAFQSGGQIVVSRLLAFNEVPTTVLTSVYCDLMMDQEFFARDNVKRNRRASSVLCFLVGGIVGGWVSRSHAGLAVVFWLGAAIKFSIAIGFLLWKPSTKVPQ